MASPLPALTATTAIAMVALTGCGGPTSDTSSGSGPYGAPRTTPAPATSAVPAGGAELAVAASPLGRIVVNGQRMTAYYFTKDTPGSGKSACAGPCLKAWPPITTASGTPRLEGVTAKVGTITLADGSRQITVDDRPVYLFAKDSRPGDVLGQGVNGAWYVLGPDGAMITAEP